MREIKFRVWDTEIRRMATWDMPLDCWVHWLKGEDPKAIVMQYTGLKDKHGKEIWEGDILSYPKHKGYYLMKWICDEAADVSDCGFTCERNKPSYNYMLPSVWKRMKVVDNIYENPDLLGETASSTPVKLKNE